MTSVTRTPTRGELGAAGSGHLPSERSHRGRNSMETTVALLERVVFPKLNRSGISGLDAVAASSGRCPVAACLAQIHRTAQS